jgi:hypothetical protein
MCVPKLGCPLCWPLLAGLCSVLGVPFHYVDAALLTLALSALVGCLAVIARRRGRGCGPLLLAAASLLLIVMFRAFDLAVPVNYAGSLGLAASTAWYVMRAQHKGFTRARTTAATCSVVAPESSCFAPLRRT